MGLNGRCLHGFVLLAAVLQAGPIPAADAGKPWPAGLAEAAGAHRRTLTAEQQAIRDSTLQTTLGVEETVQFDLVNHACHRGPGQAWRDYAEPELIAVDGEVARVQYSFELYFRQALTLDEMFKKPWREGSDGEIEVKFHREGGRWAPVSKKELLNRKDGGIKGRDGSAPHSKGSEK